MVCLQNNFFHGVCKEATLNKCIFHVSVQLLPSSLMCHRKIKSNMINQIHERYLRIIIT